MAQAAAQTDGEQTVDLSVNSLLPAGAAGELRKVQLTVSRSRATPFCDPHPPFLDNDIGEEMSRGDATETAASEEAFEEKTSCCANVDTTAVHADNADVGTTSLARGVADDRSTLKNFQRCCIKIDSRVSVSFAIWVGDETLADT